MFFIDLVGTYYYFTQVKNDIIVYCITLEIGRIATGAKGAY